MIKGKMGNDANLLAIKNGERATLFLGRAYKWNKELMNKQIPKDTLTNLKLVKKKFEMSLQKIDFFGENYSLDLFEDIITFLEDYSEFDIFLIDDYFEGKKK